METEIYTIAAMSKNRVIGYKNKLPWNIPEDLKRFKKLTFGNPVIMGRKTFESIGKVLPGRRNVIITRNKEYFHPNIEVVKGFSEALKLCRNNKKIFFIGGAEIYKNSLKYSDFMELTIIKKNVHGDVFFPNFKMSDWQIINEIEFESHSFLSLKKLPK